MSEEPEFPRPIVETVDQAPETDIAPIPLLDNQDLYPQVEAPDAGATPLCRSHRTVKKPQRLVPTFASKTYQSTAAVTTHLVHPDAHLDSNYVLVAHYIMAQFSMKAGLKRFKERGEEAVTKELSQLHFRDTFEPINPKDLNEEDILQVLGSHLFLKEKRDTTVKGRMVARGNKQRGTIGKQDASSPTAALESVLLTAVINAKEGRDVAVIGIPNAFVQTRLENEEDKAVMRLRGKLAELMVKVAPKIYTKYVIINRKGKTALYVRLLNALYGIMKAALLYYQRFVTNLQSPLASKSTRTIHALPTKTSKEKNSPSYGTLTT